MRKMFTIIGFMFFVIGVILAVFSVQVYYTKEIDKWNVGFCTIRPGEEPCWGRKMPSGAIFELNISASDTVRVRIGVPVYDEAIDKVILKNVIFNRVGTNFTQKVEISESSTYQVEIKNEGTNPVNASGTVYAKKIVHQTVHPYSSLTTPIILGSFILLIYGAFAKSEKRYTKARRAR